MTLRALVTGISGFVGGHLAEHLLTRGWEVWGCSLHAAVHKTGVDSGVHIVQADLTDSESTREAILRSRPDVIFHLAAQAAVGPSHERPWDTLRANVGMQANVLEVVRHNLPQARVLVVGSGEEYGLAGSEDMPLSESAPLRPLSPYAVSKIAQDFLGLQYFLSYNVQALRVRPFNHIGPRQGLGFVAADFAKQLAEAEKGLREPIIRVGNLEAERDFSDVRDVVRAYELLARLGVAGEVYNVASGRRVRISALLGMLLAECRVDVRIEKDAARMRPSDVPVFVGDYGKLWAQTGWEPEISLEQTVQDVMQYWRFVIAGGANC